MKRSDLLLMAFSLVVLGYAWQKASDMDIQSETVAAETSRTAAETSRIQELIAKIVRLVETLPRSADSSTAISPASSLDRAGLRVLRSDQAREGRRFVVAGPLSAVLSHLSGNVRNFTIVPAGVQGTVTTELVFGEAQAARPLDSLESIQARVNLLAARSNSDSKTTLAAVDSAFLWEKPNRPAPFLAFLPFTDSPAQEHPLIEQPPLKYLGTVQGGPRGTSGIFRDQATGQVISVCVGDKFLTWLVIRISQDEAVLAPIDFPSQTVTLRRNA